MKTISLHVYWENSEGYDRDVCVSEKAYRILKKHRDEHLLSDFRKDKIRDELKEIYDELKYELQQETNKWLTYEDLCDLVDDEDGINTKRYQEEKTDDEEKNKMLLLDIMPNFEKGEIRELAIQRYWSDNVPGFGVMIN